MRDAVSDCYLFANVGVTAADMLSDEVNIMFGPHEWKKTFPNQYPSGLIYDSTALGNIEKGNLFDRFDH